MPGKIQDEASAPHARKGSRCNGACAGDEEEAGAAEVVRGQGRAPRFGSDSSIAMVESSWLSCKHAPPIARPDAQI